MKCQVIKSKDSNLKPITFYYKEIQNDEALSSDEEAPLAQNTQVGEQIKEILNQIQS
jgi:hypothetical protein